jgi:hypothetical protein
MEKNMASTKMDAMQVKVTEDEVSQYYEVGLNPETGQLAGSCAGGTMSCDGYLLATAHLSNVYDEVLLDATLLINRILTDVGSRRKDQRLMLCNVGNEILLLWGGRELPKGFRPIEDITELRQVLGVKTTETDNGQGW